MPAAKLFRRRKKRCRHGACPLFPPGAVPTVAERGTGTVATSRSLGATMIEATEPVPFSATADPRSSIRTGERISGGLSQFSFNENRTVPLGSGAEHQPLAGKGVDRHSLPVIAMRSIPHIYRRADFPHRAVPRKSPLLGNRSRSSYTPGQKSLNESRPMCLKCFKRSRKLSSPDFRLNFMHRSRMRIQRSKLRYTSPQWDHGVAK